jgi:adenylate cyclase
MIRSNTKADTQSISSGRNLEHARSWRRDTYRPAAILFADMIGFTRFCATNDPARVLTTLRHVLTLISDHVLAHGGSVEAILGDGVMAAFYGSVLKSREASAAVRCAIAVQSAVDTWNRGTNRDPVKLAVGIHTGRVIVGSLDGIGPQRVILGDTVNVASRVEGKCRDVNATFLVTSQAVRKLAFEGESVMVKQLVNFGFHEIRGRDGHIQLFGRSRKTSALVRCA